MDLDWNLRMHMLVYDRVSFLGFCANLMAQVFAGPRIVSWIPVAVFCRASTRSLCFAPYFWLGRASLPSHIYTFFLTNYGKPLAMLSYGILTSLRVHKASFMILRVSTAFKVQLAGWIFGTGLVGVCGFSLELFKAYALRMKVQKDEGMWKQEIQGKAEELSRVLIAIALAIHLAFNLYISTSLWRR